MSRYYRKMKLFQFKKTTLISKEIDKERQIQLKLINSQEILNRIKDSIQKKLLLIKFNIVQLEFTLSEFCKL